MTGSGSLVALTSEVEGWYAASIPHPSEVTAASWVTATVAAADATDVAGSTVRSRIATLWFLKPWP